MLYCSALNQSLIRGRISKVSWYRCVLVTASFLLFPAAKGLWAERPQLPQIVQQARAALGAEADLKQLSSLQLVGQLSRAGARQASIRLVVIAKKPSYHRFELRDERVVETTLSNGAQACILRAKLPNGRPQMRWLAADALTAINHSVHQLFYFYQPNREAGEILTYAGITQRHEQSCHRLVYRYPSGKQTIRHFNVSTGRLVSVVDWNDREAVVLKWSQVQGIHFPKRVAYYRLGQALHTIEYTQIVANNDLDDHLFAMPEIDKNK